MPTLPREIWFRRLAGLLLLLGASPALADDSSPAAKQTSVRLRPAGLEGAVLLENGPRPSSAAWQQFMELAGGEQANVTIIELGAMSAHVNREDFGAADGVPVVEIPSRAVASDDQPLAKLTDAPGIWMVGDEKVAKLLRIVKDSRLADQLLEFRLRGGIIGASGEAVELLDSQHGLGILPGFAVDVATNDDVHAELAAGLVQVRLAPGAIFQVRDRQMMQLGEAQVSLGLARSEQRAKRVQELSRNDREDYNQWRRAAQERANVASPYPPLQAPRPHVPRGALVIVGGGGLPAEIAQRFVDLGGGADGVFIVLPTAMPDPLPPGGGEFLKRYGAKEIHVLTAREQADLETPETLALLDKATALWFGGGRQWRFLDAYQGTQLEKKFHAVLARGGVIGGSSAGATIQGDYLARGAPAGPHIMMCEGYERSFGFLPGVAIDQHFTQRNRFRDMTSLMQTYPQFLGIGIDEATALVVQQSEAKVLGRGQVHFYNYDRPIVAGTADYESVAAGGAYDLAARQILTDDEQ